MKTIRLGVILLAFLLAGMAMVPMVSAQNIPAADLALANELNAVSLNPSNNQLSQLQFNSTQQPATVTGEFQSDATTRGSQITSLMATSASPEVSKIPFGAIVYHSNDGMTTVFDSSGQQLFRVEDDTAPLVNTPNGALPATSVFEVPDKSLVVDNGNAINVFYDNQRILTVMGNSTSSRKKTTALSRYAPQTLSSQWIEYGETAPITTVQQFSAQWNVPKSPVSVYNYSDENSVDGSQSTIWNGLETTSGYYLLQPVLEWYARSNPSDPIPTIANWSFATWWISSNESSGNGIHSTRRYGNVYTDEPVARGDVIQGNMMYSSGVWTGATSDLTLGVSSTLFLNTSQSSALSYQNLQAYTVLEGWSQKFSAQYPSQSRYNASYLPGNVTFKNIIINDMAGDPVVPATIYGYVNSYWNYPKYGLSVTNSSWPTNITLHTGNI